MRSQINLASLRLLVASCFVALLGSPAWSAPPDPDTQEVSRYVLTEAGLAKYTAATQKLSKMATGRRAKCDDSSSSSLSQIVAKYDATPGAKSAIQSAGMTTREFVVFSFSLLQTGIAAWGLDQPGAKLPPGMSMENVKFYRAHKAAIDKLGTGKKDECGDAEDARDNGE